MLKTLFKPRVFLIIPSFAAVAALAQDAPTGIVKGGSFGLIRTESRLPTAPVGTAPTVTEFFSGGFQSTDYSKIPPFTPPEQTTIDPCTILALGQTPQITVNPMATTPLDAGSVLTMTGPKGTKTFPAMKFVYGGLLADSIFIPLPGAVPPEPWLAAGSYTIDNGAGGADIGPFTATLTVSDPLFAWTNSEAITSVDRSAGVDVVWVGGDPASKVFISGSVVLLDAAFKATGGASFNCVVDNSAGHFTVSPDVLGLLPASPPASVVPTSTLTVSNSVQTKFDAPGSDLSFFSFGSGGSKSVTYK